jgi:hypothetical protein
MDAGLERERVEGCHWLLLRLAGTVADDLTCRCRYWLAEERTTDVGRAIAYAVLSQRIPLSDDEIDLLAELLGAAGMDTSALSMVDIMDTDPMPKYAFAAGREEVDRGCRIGAADDRPAAPVAGAPPDDDVDRAILAVMDRDSYIRAVWRVWRFPGDRAPWPPPRRVYVVEVDRGAPLAGIAAWLQYAVAAAGPADPQIEVYPVRAALPSYQRLARAYGALIWAREPDPGLRVATVPDPSGPAAPPDQVTLPEPERHRLAAYLSGGEPLLVTTARMNDVVTPALGAVVPTNFRTDGRWIWNDATVYYLQRYGLAPEPDLVAHIRRVDFVPPEVDGAAIHRALAALQEPAGDEPAWTYGS